MKASDKVLIQVLAVTAIAVGALYWWIPDMPWWAYLVAGLLLASGGYSQAMKSAASKRILDEPAKEKR